MLRAYILLSLLGGWLYLVDKLILPAIGWVLNKVLSHGQTDQDRK